MAGKTVDIEALEMAANALSEYIDEVNTDIQKMKDAAVDCSDNMGSDVYSKRAIIRLEVCARSLAGTISEAEALREKILKKKRQIEESGRSF